jgi:phage terminase small subunit
VLVSEALANVGMLQRQHLPFLEAFSELVGLAREARRELDKGGQVMVTKQGPIVSPWLKAYRDNVKLAVSIGEHLGASPVALARLGIATIKGLTLQQELVERHGEKEAS